jgi:hypothetical protein
MARTSCKSQQRLQANLRIARRVWPQLIEREQAKSLEALSADYLFSVALGDLLFLDGKWDVTHAGLLRLAQRRHCAGIRVQQVPEFCDAAACRWVFKATIYKNCRSKGFVGYGDADPSNTSPLVRGAEMRVAETRAVNRALRKAYGIGLCSVEELSWLTGSHNSAEDRTQAANQVHRNGSNNGQPRLRDRLCVLIRRYNLDPGLVKAYAADFCGTPTLKEANRELVESFVSHLETSAQENRDALICKLNSYLQPMEVKS